MRFGGFLKLFVTLSLLLASFPLFTPQLARAQASPEGDKVNNWINNFNGDDKKLTIIYPDQSQPNNPPYIVSVKGKKFIPSNSTSGRPNLVFKLVATSFNGNLVVNAIKWLVFQGYQVDDKGENPQIIPNFYFLMNDCSANNGATLNSVQVDCFDIIYDTDQTHVYRGIFKEEPYPLGVMLINGNTSGANANIGGLEISDPDINKIFGYIMDVPKDGSPNCGLDRYTTGPPSQTVDGATVDEVQKKFSLPTRHPSELNSNCGSKAGWLQYWGVIVNTQGVAGDCTVQQIFKASAVGAATGGSNGSIGAIFDQLVTCLFTSVFVPLIDWAANLVKNAAGVSYCPSTYQLAEKRQVMLSS